MIPHYSDWTLVTSVTSGRLDETAFSLHFSCDSLARCLASDTCASLVLHIKR